VQGWEAGGLICPSLFRTSR